MSENNRRGREWKLWIMGWVGREMKMVDKRGMGGCCWNQAYCNWWVSITRPGSLHKSTTEGYKVVISCLIYIWLHFWQPGLGWSSWQLCHTYQAFQLPVCTSSGNLQNFPTATQCNQRQLDFFSLEPNSTLLANSGKTASCSHNAAYSEVGGTYHVTVLECVWKLFKVLGWTTSSVIDVGNTSRLGVIGKSKTEHVVRNSTSLQ